MHSSRMRTTSSLNVSRSICRGAYVPCMPPATHAPHHAQPLPHMPPATHNPPAMHAPHHTCPPAIHTPPPCTPPVDRQTPVKT